ncbi:hypothetical protein [uncultured Paraglaciecola sp.]|uniref:hypothetical protein n=1 Tax=uncultured Paraglaciecola sp. TaxID=1765024 RepID=UPI002593A58A|nr:hypothetical protein [uncultured Paraglaciecola sp.]
MASLSSNYDLSLIQSQLKALVTTIRRRALLQRLAYSLVCVVVVWAGFYLTLGLNIWLYVILACMPLGFCWQLTRTSKYQRISDKAVLQHINREFPECEESAHLIVVPDESLNLLQRLQKARITSKVAALLAKDLSTELPRYPAPIAIAITVFVLLAVIAIKFVGTQSSLSAPSKVIALPQGVESTASIKIESSVISIQPPTYTGLPKVETTDFNLQLVTGSNVTWQLTLSSDIQASELGLKIGQEQIEFTRNSDTSYTASTEISTTGIYFITQRQNAISDIFTLEVTADTPPNIRFIEPTQTIIEIPKNAEPHFVTRVQIQDDFGLSKVEILGSIASGSGESVKFRDQTFVFDSQQLVNDQNEFFKEWDLSALGMQPGDELYFSVRAYDNAWKNNQPAPQLTRSANKIVRWLEEDQEGIQSEGILLDFVPEYFKSQRQIIIETQELIANQVSISNKSFVDTSRALGSAQSDLKQKYGQFLGDEFEATTLHAMEAGPSHHHDEHEKSKALPHPLIEAHEQQDEQEEALREEAESRKHQHSEHESSNDKSGFSQAIEQFGHAHGATDDGNFVKRGVPSPITLMKRSIANMWQAELHLQLAEPAKALPFENQALEYLNRAKRAERIYVKRLGFEPPPVSDKRRYEGDLSEILSYERNEQIKLSKPNLEAIKGLLNLLSHTTTKQTTQLTQQQLNNLNLVKNYFTEQLANSPEDIVFIATLEKISLAAQLPIKNCNQCLANLRAKLWQAIPAPIAEPVSHSKTYLLNNSTVQYFNEFIQQNKQEKLP